MNNLNKKLGTIIKTYRKAQGLTLEKLADLICKSKSTVGKYEQGEISIDIETLSDIAKALGLRPVQLFSELEEKASTDNDTITTGVLRRYFYTYDGFFHKILRGIMVISDPNDNNSPVSLFYDVHSFDKPEDCRVLYVGHLERHETITKYLLQKRGGIESPQLCFTPPLDYQGLESGIFFGISSRTQVPVSLKCIMSDKPLAEDEQLIDLLMISKDDLRLTKKFNQFLIEPRF